MLEKIEVQELALSEKASLCKEHLLKFLSFPIPDRGVPSSHTDTQRLVQQIKFEIDQGSSVAIHCRMGIGRSSIIAGAVLLKLNYSVDSIFQQISKARGLKVPDTDEQVEWLKKHHRLS